MKRQTLKALLAFLIAVLAAGVAGADEAPACRPGAMEFRQGERVMKVNETAAASRGDFDRVVFRGTVAGKPYVFDVQTMPGAAPGGFLSRSGTQPDRGGLPVRWGRAPKGWSNGMTLDINQGPLLGAWDARCRG